MRQNTFKLHMAPGDEEHITLLNDFRTHDGMEQTHFARTVDSQSLPSKLSLAIVLLAVVAVMDLFAIVIAYRIFRTSCTKVDMANLEFANPYTGLAELYSSGYANASEISPILNKPRFTAQVFRSSPDKPAPIGEDDVWGVHGLLAPNERHLRVDPDVRVALAPNAHVRSGQRADHASQTHTIAQFRAVDFGMEECSLVLRLPASDERVEGDRPFVLNESSRLQVCTLDAPRLIDVRGLSWRTRPACAKPLESITAQSGEEVVARFPCPWGSLHTFELGCAEQSECLLDVWSTQNQTWGLYMYQHQTV
ncbi:hypothetical protein B0H21DRAFT_471993 [Amylocystis lapponica]|nr:hypothetical protein B0H21DRAFT_471993 [Amylocystis lapponica]